MQIFMNFNQQNKENYNMLVEKIYWWLCRFVSCKQEK